MITTLGEPPHDLARRWIRGFIWRAPIDLAVADLLAVSQAALRRRPLAPGVLGGRDSVFVHHLDACGSVVVKEYRRGGHVSQVVRLHHLRRGPSRGEREFRNLRAVRALGIHAPEPVAFASRGLVIYRGWLVTRLVENRGSLAALGLRRANGLEELVAATAWQVASLIDRRVLHADLHPGNVIVDLHDVPCLLDFDRAFRFDGSPLELGRRYVGRWFRAVRKHGLPDVLGQVFQQELARAVGVRPARIHDVAPASG